MKNFMKKRGVSLSIQVIVVAALALLVLLVLVLIFNSRAKDWVEETSSCERRGGICVKEEQCDFFSRSPYGCPAEGYVCCISQCLSHGGVCQEVCKEDYETEEQECNNKCPAGFKRLYYPGCSDEQVCCKPLQS